MKVIQVASCILSALLALTTVSCGNTGAVYSGDSLDLTGKPESERLSSLWRRAVETVEGAWLRRTRSPEFQDFPLPRQTPGPGQGGIIVRFLTRNRQERGCLAFHRGVVDLEEAAGAAALRAAFSDPRYPPLKPEERNSLLVEVALLSPWQPLGSWKDFRIGSQSLLMEHPLGSVMMQPTVALEKNWNLERLLEALCRKEGLPAGAWKHPEARFFTAGTVWLQKPWMDDLAPENPQ